MPSSGVGTTSIGANQVEVSIDSIKDGVYHTLLKVGSSYSNKAFVKGN